MRKHRIAQLKADIACGEVLKPRIQKITEEVEAQGAPHFSALVERFKTNPSPEKPPTNSPDQKTYDEMLLNLMLQVWEEAKKKGVEKDDPKLSDTLVAGLKEHLVKMDEHQAKLRKDLEHEEEEQHKRITMEDIHDGFDSHVRPSLIYSHSPLPTRSCTVCATEARSTPGQGCDTHRQAQEDRDRHRI